MPDRPAPKRIKSMDELLMAVEPESQPTNIKSGVVRLNFSQVDPYPNHPFRLYSGERLDDMVASISNYGILTPMITRIKDNGRYEMLAGHNRMNAGTLAGLDEGDFIIKENLSDEEAWMYVIETNVMQRSFADMLPSEKAAVLALRHSKMFSQGKRNDIIAELRMLENPQYIKEKSTSPLIGEKLHSDVQLGIEYGLSKNSVSRLLRIDKLTQALKGRVDASQIGIYPAVALSYLVEAEQQEVEKVLSENEFKVDMKKAEMLRSYSEGSKLNEKTAYQILSGEINKKPKSTTPAPVKIKHKVYSKYFSADTKASEIERIVDEALEWYFSNKLKEGTA
ncbi:Chromosome (plasmid) partitioning protein ParB [Desulfosporosinus sp. I2]|uniref:ParB N-terminal domain-containing protein n=1 Tax=Desulfosporosinus sp. I2 TaxID=1617025 RepID=UPI00061E6552|nr:ParB N-terminal domain-containing protein [Desulfosporosinus sp. I2]KJR45801.1 Chromosome (plasmid) partitioning protein ParB [Desulfosporosinus sp. I2]